MRNFRQAALVMLIMLITTLALLKVDRQNKIMYQRQDSISDTFQILIEKWLDLQ